MRQENSCIFLPNKCTIRAYGWYQFISFLLLYALVLLSYVNICIIQLLMKRKYQMPEPSSEKRNNAKLSIRQRKKLQLDFINQLGPMGHLLKTTLDICPDIFAWFANMEDRLMFVNRLNVQMCNLRSELDVLGKTCADLWPAHMATIYMGRCHQVRTTGQPIIDTVYDHAADYSTELRITHVLPLKTPNGEIIGTMTIYRRASSNESIPDWYGNMKKAVAYIDAHYAENISIADIARIRLFRISIQAYFWTRHIKISQQLHNHNSSECRPKTADYHQEISHRNRRRSRILRPKPFYKGL